MTDFKPLLLTAAKPLGFDDELELLFALADIVEGWATLAPQVKDIASAEELIGKLAADLESPAMATAFEKAGLAPLHAKLKTYLGKVIELSGEVPAKYKLLLRTLGSFSVDTAQNNGGLVDWTLIDEGKDVDIEDGRYSIGVSGKAGIEFEAADWWNFASDAVADPMLRLRASGSANVKGSAAIPFSVGSVGGGAEASASVSLDYYFKAPGKELYALAVARRIPKLPDPFDYDSVWSAFAESDLAGLVYEFRGDAKAHVEVSLADSIALGHGIVAELGASIRVGVGLGGKYVLSFRSVGKPDKPELIATLTRSKTSTEELAAQLGLTVDLGAVAKQVHGRLTKLLDQWDKVLNEVKPFLSPGTWLQGKAAGLLDGAAKDLIKGGGLRAAVVRDLRGLIGIDTGDKVALASWVSEQIAGAFDRVSTAATGEIDKVVDEVLAKLGDALPAFAQAELRPKLEEKLRALATETQAKYVDKVRAIVALDQPARLGAALKKAGAAVAGAVETLDAALAGVRQLIEKYDKLARDIVAKVGDAAKAKVSAKLQLEYVRTDKVDYLIVGRLTQGSGARRAFQALAHGRMGDLEPLFRKPELFPGFDLDEERSSLKLFSKSVARTGFEIVLFGLKLTWEEVVTATGEILVDGMGNVRVASSGEIKRSFSGPDEKREVSFADTHSLVLAKALDAGGAGRKDALIELGVNVVHRDESLKRVEIQGFLASLAGARLIPADAPARGVALFNKWGSSGSDARLVADISAKLWLTGEQVRQMLRIDQRDSLGRLPRASAIDIGDKGFLALDRRKLLGQGERPIGIPEFTEAYQYVVNILEHEYRQVPLATLLYDYDRKRYLRPDIINQSNREKQQLADFEAVSRRVRALADLVDLMGQIYLARPQIQPGDGGWDEQRYRDEQGNMVEKARGWLALGLRFLWFRSDVHPRTIALMDVLTTLAGVHGTTAVTVVVTNRQKGQKPETVALL